MPTINDRIGSQNVIRVLSNASAPPTRLVNLQDVDSTRSTEDGMLLVWNYTDETFYMTDALDASSLVISGITTFSNTTISSGTDNGALVVIGGVGIGDNLNVAGNTLIAGVSTFTGAIDANGTLDVDGDTQLDDLNVAGVATFSALVDVNNRLDVVGGSNLDQLNVTGVSTFAGIVTTSSDLYIGGDLYVSDDITIDELNARNLNITGISTFVGVGSFLSDLYVTGNISCAGTITSEDVVNIDSLGIVTARQGFRAVQGGIYITAGVSTFGGDATVAGTLTAGLIDGGSY